MDNKMYFLQNKTENNKLAYLNSYHLDKGYMVTFSFNQKKEIGVRQVEVDSKMIIEAVV